MGGGQARSLLGVERSSWWQKLHSTPVIEIISVSSTTREQRCRVSIEQGRLGCVVDGSQERLI